VARAALVGLLAGVGLAAVRTTIVSREVRDSLEFLVIGPRVAEIAGLIVASVAVVVAAHVVLLRRHHADPAAAAYVYPARWTVPLLACLLPALGVVAAMMGGPVAGPMVYGLWELSPWWLGCAVTCSAARALALDHARAGGLPRTPLRWRWVYVLLGCAVAAWTWSSNASLRSWRGPIGDEPRYLRYVESWSQGRGVDIGRVARLSDLQRDDGPRVGDALALAARTFWQDAAGLIEDVRASITDPSFRWDRMTSGDGSFVTGRGGGSFQSHQPGLSLILFPAYVIDRHVFSGGTVYGGQFPDRLPLLHATLLLIVALGSVASAALCRRVGLGPVEAAAFAFLAWASFPASAMALQIYPETTAALAIAGSLALATRASTSPPLAFATGVLAGFPWFLHVRFVLVAVLVFLYGSWTWRADLRRLAMFAAGWSLPVLAQLWFVYHATGIPWPTAFYRTADQSVVRAAVVPGNMLRFFFDRDWGFLPHAPLLLLVFAGLAALWRIRKDLALAVAGVTLCLTATAATHNVAAGGGTPDRLVTGMIPLLFLPVAALFHAFRHHPGLRLVIVVLALLSLDQAWDYNRAHVKEVGVFVSPGASGWRINLTFPYLSDEFGVRTARALLAAIVPAAIVLVLAVRQPGGSGASAVRALAAVAGVAAACLSIAGAWSLWHPRYRVNEQQARASVVDAYVRAGSCALCWSSRTGPLRPQELAANSLESVTLTARPASGRQASFALSAQGPDGPVFGTLRVDFGDGQVRAPQLINGAVAFDHEYRAPGEYKVTAWVSPPGAAPRVGTAVVKIEPGSM
jgi:hypothetical protein